MKVSTTVDFTEADRRNVARFHGNDGLASHIQCVAWSAQQIRGSLNVMAQAGPRQTLTAIGDTLVTRGAGTTVSRSGNTP